MLTTLKVQNLALAEQVNWSLEKGLVAVTGETGAGKSVIIGALKILAGERADKGLIRSGEEKAVVQGMFSLEESSEVDAILSESGISECEDGSLLLRRVIGEKRSRQFINDEPCTLATMKKVGVLLMDLHGPHDHQSLLSNEKQLQLLDRYAGNKDLNAEYRKGWQDYLSYKAEYEAFLESEMLSDDELDLYRYQLEEIQSANLNEEAITTFEEDYQRASNANAINESVVTALEALHGEGGVIDKLNELSRICRDLEGLDSSLEKTLSPVMESSYELEEVTRTLNVYLEALEVSPESVRELEEQMNQLESLKRKYGGSVESIIAHAERVERKLAQTEERESLLVTYTEGVAQLEKGLSKVAVKLTKKRASAAPVLAKEIMNHLKELGFKQAIFDVEIHPSDEPSVYGMESVDFAFGPNPGEPVRSLKAIASSGEMSRVMLALKSSLAEHDEVPLLVFDEIDANVGGEIATAVGQKMLALSKSRQILSITHFPQVAALAPYHFLVEKRVQDERTTSHLVQLSEEARIMELIRMIGSSGEQARALAISLLKKK